MATFRTSQHPFGGVVTSNANRDSAHPFGGVISEQLISEAASLTTRTYMSNSGSVVTVTANKTYMSPLGGVISERLLAAEEPPSGLSIPIAMYHYMMRLR